MTFGRITFKESKDQEMKVTETIREEPIKSAGLNGGIDKREDDDEEVIDMPMIEEDSD